MIKALIFDFDGLILETEGPVFQSWLELFQSYDCSLTMSDWACFIGTTDVHPFDLLEQRLGRSLDRSGIDRPRAQREAELIAQQPIQPGVLDYLQSARRLRLKVGLASSSTCSWVTGHLTRLGLLSYFDCLLARDDVQRGKPDPELYLTVLKFLNVSANQAIALEDSPNGILAARGAWIFCVAVPNDLTRQLPLNHANLVIDSLAATSLEELLRMLEQQNPI
jgi:HAD superfamily hydrolase (TIGR01509 family)